MFELRSRVFSTLNVAPEANSTVSVSGSQHSQPARRSQNSFPSPVVLRCVNTPAGLVSALQQDLGNSCVVESFSNLNELPNVTSVSMADADNSCNKEGARDEVERAEEKVMSLKARSAKVCAVNGGEVPEPSRVWYYVDASGDYYTDVLVNVVKEFRNRPFELLVLCINYHTNSTRNRSKVIRTSFPL